MKKTLLTAFAALLCAITLHAQTTGAGTQDNPYVVSNGSTYTVPAGQTVYATINAASDGTLTLIQNNWNQLGFSFTDGTKINVAFGLSMDGIGFKTDITAGTYTFYNTSTQSSDVVVTVGFDGKAEDGLKLNMTDPAEGTTFDKIDASTSITAYLSGEVHHVVAALFDNDDDEVYYQLTADVDTLESNVVYVTYEWGEIPMYQGHDYYIRLQCYLTDDPAEQPQVLNVHYAGSQQAATVSNISIVSVTPEAGVTYPTADQMLNFAAGLDTVVVVFDGKVLVDDVKMNDGYGFSTPVDGYYTTTNDLGNTVLVAKIPAFYATQANIILAFAVTDEQGNATEDTGNYANTKTENYYALDLAVADARVVDYGLEPATMTPANAAYVTLLDTVVLDFDLYSQQVPVRVLDAANASLYRATAAGPEFVANAILAVTDESLTCTSVNVTFVDENLQPMVVTTPGVYTLRVDSMSIADVNFDELAPWSPGYGGLLGSCNPTLEFTFNVVESIAEVVSVSPAPYVEGGAYNTEIPSTITLEMSEAGVQVNSAYFSLGLGRREPVTYSVSGTTITLTVPESAQQLRDVTIVLSATSANGVPVNYCNDDPELSLVMLNYKLTPAVLMPTEVSPADSSVVAELSTVTLTVDESTGLVLSPVTTNVYLYDQNGQSAALCAVDYPEDVNIMNQLVITFSQTVTAAGTYRLVVPENTFMSLDETIYNPELTYTFTVDPTLTAINGIEADRLAANAAAVYSITGQRVNTAATPAGLKTLRPGLYIVGGKKLVVK